MVRNTKKKSLKSRKTKTRESSLRKDRKVTKLQDEKDQTKSIKKEPVGTSGTAFSSGQFEEDYLDKLNYPEAYDEYNKMRRGDYKVQGVLRALYTTISSATFKYIPEDKKDEEQVKQADFKNNLLYKWLDRTWYEHLNEILTMLPFGFSIFEPYYKMVEDEEFGTIAAIKTFGFLKQDTIHEWDIKNGEIVKIHQLAYSSFIGGESVDVWIDGNELLVFTNLREGDNFVGIPMIRGAYGPYFRKNLYSKIDMIGFEKFAIGTPVFYAPTSILNDQKEKEKIEEIGSTYTAHEKAFILLNDMFKDGGFEIVKGEYDGDGVDKAVRREDVAVSATVMATFLDIGTLQAGGNAQNEGQMELFLNSLLGIANYIASQIDKLTKYVYELNYGKPKVNLKMQVSGITKDDAERTMKIITGYSKHKVLTPDDNLESFLREKNNLPEHDPDSAREVGNVNPGDEEEKDEEDKLNDVEIRDHKLINADELTEAEKAVNLKDIERFFDRSEDKYKEIIEEHLKKMKAKYMADLRTALKQENKSAAVVSIKIGFDAQLREALKDYVFNNVYDKGRKDASKEIGLKKLANAEKGVVSGILSKISFDSKQAVSNIVQKFENNSTSLAISLLEDNPTNKEVEDGVNESLNNFIDGTAAYASTGAMVNRYYNLGRNNTFYSNPDQIQALQYSSVLDSKTTDLCRSLNRQVFLPTDGKALTLRPPNHFRCRSILVAVTLNMELPKITGLKIKPVGDKSVKEIEKQKSFCDCL